MSRVGSISAHLAVLLGLNLFFSAVTLGQDTCEVFCDSLELSISIDSPDGCDLSFSFGVTDSLIALVDTAATWNWILDGDTLGLGNDSALVLNDEQIQGGEVLALNFEVNLGDSLGICECIETLDLIALTEDFDWACGCEPEGEPLANFAVIGEGQCGYVPVLLDNQSSGFGLDFDWEFGPNGIYGTSELSSPEVQIYVDGGGTSNVPVTLTVTDANGCTDLMSEMVQVLQVPNAGLEPISALCVSDLTWPNYAITLFPQPFGMSGIASLTVDWGNGTDTTFTPALPFIEMLSTPYDEFGEYVITVEATGNNGCQSTTTGDLFVGNNPQIGTANPGNTDGLCSPYQLTFPITNFESNAIGTDYTVNFGDGTPSEIFAHPPPEFVNHDYTVASCGSTTPLNSYNAFYFQVDASNACGTSIAYIDPVRIHQAPDPVINGPTPVCEDLNVLYQITGNGVQVYDCAPGDPLLANDPACNDANGACCPGGDGCVDNFGYWFTTPLQGQGASIPASAEGLNLSVTFPDAGIYLLNYIESHDYCPTGYAAKEVCVFPELDPELAYSTDGQCFPLTVDLQDITEALPCGNPFVEWVIEGGAYAWDAGSDEHSANPTLVLLDKALYTITLEHSVPGSKSNVCGVYTEAITIEVNGPPIMELSPDVMQCEQELVEGQIVSLDDCGAPIEMITWSVEGIVEALDVTSQEFTFPTGGVYSIDVEAMNACGTDTESIAVEIQENPELTLTTFPDGGVCDGDQVTFQVSGADEFNWNLNQDPFEESGETITLNPNVDVVGTVTGVTMYSSLSCSSTLAFDFQVFELPELDVNAPDYVCFGEEFVANASVTGGQPEYLVQWTFEANQGVGNFFSTTTESEGTFLLAFEVTDDRGCQDFLDVEFDVLALPTVQAGSDMTLCNQDYAVSLDENLPLGGNWFGTGIVDEQNGIFNPDGLTSGIYQVGYQFVDEFGCSNLDSLNIQVDDPIEADAGDDVIVCESDSMLLLVGYYPSESVTWSGPALNLDSNSIDLSQLSPDEYVYTISTGVESCETQDELTLQVLQRPEVNISGPAALCQNELGIFEVQISGGLEPYSIQWLSDINLESSDGSVVSFSTSVAGLLELEVLVIDSNGCTTYAAFSLEIFELPEVFGGIDLDVCLQDFPAQIEGASPGLNEDGTGIYIGIGESVGAVAVDGLFDPLLVGIGMYEVEYVYTDAATGCANSDTVDVTVIPNLFLTMQPLDSSYCQFASPVIPLEVMVEGGTGAYSYQWYVSTTASNTAGAEIAGATTSSYVPPVDVVGTLYYYCVITQSGANCEVVSEVAEIVTNESPDFTMTLLDQEVCLDGSLDVYEVTFANGTGVPSYQWYWNDVASNTGGTALLDETLSTFQPLSDGMWLGETWYYCEVTFSFGGCEMITSDPVLVNVVPDPSISVQPLATDTLCVGGSPYLPLAVDYANGTGTVSYQWFLGDGSLIVDATNATYLPPSYDTPGTYEYYAEVSLSGSGCEVAQSAEAEVVVVADPVVTLQPLGASYCQDAAFVDELMIAVEGGTGAYSYQWFVSTTASNTGGAEIVGATTSSYVPPVDVVGTLYYYCVITQSGANCEVVSEVAEIVTNESPDFTMTLLDQEVCLDGSLDVYEVTFANGTGVPSYQWYWNDVASNTGGTALLDETLSTFQPLSDGMWLGETWYYCEVTFSFGGCEMITSDPVLVNVVPDPSISVQPLATDTLCVGGSPYLPLAVDYANGTGTVSYQWFLGDGSLIVDATNATYLPPSYDTPGTYEYYAEVSLSGSGCEVAQSAEAEVVVVADPVVTLQPLGASYCQDAASVDELMIAVDGGTGAYSYQWFVSTTASNTGGAEIVGATTSSYVPPVDVVGTLYYYCVITQSGANCEVVSEVAEIVTNESPDFTMTLLDQEVCLDGSLDVYEVTFANGTGVPSYQWYWNDVASNTGGTALLDETLSTFQPLSDGMWLGETWYYCEVTFSFGGCEMITSDPVLVNVVPDPSISVQPLATDTLCVGGSPYLPLAVDYANGTGTVSYQWFLGDGSLIVDATNATYLPPSYDTPGTYEYYAEVSLSGSGCEVAQSAEAEVVVVADPVVTLQPLGASYCQDAASVDELMIAVDGGTGAYSYQWFVSTTASNTGGAEIVGATTSSYVPPVDVVGTLYYYCVITQSGANCEVVSEVAEIVTNESPDFTMTLLDQEVCLDGSLDVYEVTFANGTGVPSYQWYWNDVASNTGGTALLDETLSTFQPLSDGMWLGETWYYCEVTFSFGGCEMITSDPVLVNVVPDPSISVQPLATDTLCVGGSPYLPLAVDYANGTGTVSYQWFLGDGSLIVDATNATYLPPSYDTPGTYEYYAEVSLSGSGCEVAQSAEAEVVVVADPVVTLQPLGASYCQDAASVDELMIAVDGGTGAYSYQWFVSTTASNTGGAEIVGATTSSYVPPVDVVGTLYYYCVITQSGANCEVVSEVAEIVTNESPDFTMTLLDQEVCLDGSLDVYEVTFANGTGVPSYQWYWNDVASNTGGTALLDETLSTFQPLSDGMWLGETWYYCEVTFSFGGCEMITSDPVLVNVVPDPSISVQPLATDTLCVGGSPYLPLAVDYANGTGTVSYQWFLGDGSLIVDATNATYLPPSYDTPGTYEYYAEVSLSGSGCEVAQSAEAEVVVVADPVVTLQPLGASYCQDAAFVDELMIAVEGGTGAYSYQWFVSTTASNTGGAEIVGATTSSYVPPVDVVGTLYYYCVITQSGANCEVVSEVAEIVTNESPDFTMTLLDQEVCLDGSLDVYEVTFANGTGVPSYQWYWNDVASNTGGTALLDETLSTFQPLSDGMWLGETWYYCEVTFSFGGCEMITSDPVLVNVVPDPSISVQPLATDTLCVGGSPYLPLAVDYANGTGTVSYQWFLGDGSLIVDATNATYLPPSYDTPGTYEYYAEVSLSGSGCEVAQSAEAEVVVVADPVVTLQPLGASYCQDAAFVDELMIAVEGGTGAYSYQWFVSTTASNTGGAEIVGATTSSYVPPVDVVGTLYYYCVITQSGANCEVVSEVAGIETNASPTFTQQPVTQTLCFGEFTQTLEVAYENGTGVPSYQWFESVNNDYTGSIIPGAESPSYLPPGDAPGSLYYYCVITFDGGGCDAITSSIASINVNNIVIGEIAADQGICFGEIPAIIEEVTATTGVGALTYQWLSGVDSPADPNPIPGELQSNYVSPALFDTTFYVLEVSSTLNGIACVDTTNAVEIIVFPLPIISLGPADVFCVNDGLVELTEFSPQGPQGGFWEGPGVVDVTGGMFDVAGPTSGVGTWELFFWYEDLVTGCRDTLWHDVTVNPIPTADFAVPVLACNNFPIDIDQNSLDVVSAVWDFGNGDQENVINPIYTYPDPGSYDIEMIVVNQFGCLDTASTQTEITYPPVAAFTMPEDSACAPFTVEFINNSDAPYASHSWMLGDSAVIFDQNDPVNTPEPTLFDQGPVIMVYDVTLEVSNLCGTSSMTQAVSVLPIPQMSFILQDDTACSPFTPDILNTSTGLPEQISWDFGNGQTEFGTITDFPTYIVDPDSSAQTFVITAIGSNQCGVDTASVPIFIYPNTIQAFFTADVESGCAPLDVTVTDLSQETTGIQYDFGNGLVAFDPVATTTYEEAGTFVISQFATNGCSLDTAYFEIEVLPQPEFTLAADQTSYCEGEEVSLVVESESIVGVDWEFGQGDTDEGTDVTVVYEDSGIFDVVALVTSVANGCTAQDMLPVLIHPTPELDIIPSFASGCTPLLVNFENNSLDGDYWDWQFGDNGSSGAEEPAHTYVNPTQDPITFSVDVFASNAEGCESSEIISIAVLPAPEVQIGGIADQYCGVPATVYPQNEAEFALDYQWFLDGTLESTVFEPVVEINEGGIFELMLVAFNEYNCSTTAVESVVVHYNPIPALNLSPMEGCPPLDVYIQDVSVGGSSSELTISLDNEIVYQGPPVTNYYLFESSGIYTLGMNVVAGTGCEVNESALETIEVFSEPFAYFEANPYDSDDSSPDLPSSLNTRWIFQNLSNDNDENYWQFGDGTASSEINPIHNYYDPGSFGVSLTVTNDYGCSDTYSEWVLIENQTPVYVPNSFTPGGVTSKPDGLNDAFRAEFRDYDLVTDYSLQIFDRWGELIWESDDPEEFWQGNVRRDGYESEYFVKMDTYTWRIRYSSTALKGTHEELTGHVTIVR